MVECAELIAADVFSRARNSDRWSTWPSWFTTTGAFAIEGDDLKLRAWNHDPQRLQSALDYWGRAVWKPRYHVLSLPGIGVSVIDRAARYLRCCSPSSGQSPCGSRPSQSSQVSCVWGGRR